MYVYSQLLQRILVCIFVIFDMLVNHFIINTFEVHCSGTTVMSRPLIRLQAATCGSKLSA